MEIHLDNGEYLDLPQDLELSISHSNPMLSKQGTYSLLVLLPGSDRNRRLLKHPDRYDRTYKHIRKFNAYLKKGTFQKKASLNIQESEDDIDSFLQMNESEMYSKMKETTLSSAFVIKRYPDEFLPDMIFDDDMDRLIKYLELVKANNFPDEDFFLFEVGTDQSEYTIHNERRPSQDIVYNVFQFINEEMRSLDRTNLVNTQDTDLNGIKYTMFRGRAAHTINLDGQNVDVPKGYGISPFLKLNYVLRRIFAYFDYTLNQSLFDTDPDLKLVAVINNTADAIVGGLIDYTQLVPDGTVHEFLDNIRKAFGCEFFVSEDNRNVNVKFWNEILDPIVMKKDYTPYLTATPRTTLVEPKTIKLTFKRSFDYTAVPYDTLTAFENSFGELGYIPFYNSHNKPSDGFYLVQNELVILEFYTNQETLDQEFKIHSRPLFDYYQDIDNIEFDERSCDIEYVPAISGYVRQIIEITPDEEEEALYGYLQMIMFIGERRHMNTVLEKYITNEDGVTERTEVSETAGSCPLGLLFYRYTNDGATATIYGTPFHYNKEGDPIGSFDLIPGGKSGLFEYFLRKLDNIYRDSFQQLNTTMKLPEKEIVNFRMDQLVCINNQPLLPELIEYIVKEPEIEVNKVVFRTIRLYKDMG